MQIYTECMIEQTVHLDLLIFKGLRKWRPTHETIPKIPYKDKIILEILPELRI